MNSNANIVKTILTICFLLICSAAKSQITLEATHSGANNTVFGLVKLGLAGDKYVLADAPNKKIEIYDLNHTLEKTIVIPSFIVNPVSIWWISDNLFNSDTKIEYRINNLVPQPHATVYVLNEDSVILFQRDTVNMSGYSASPFLNSEFGSLYPTTSGTKMILQQKSAGWEIYSLPGNLPCYECSNGVYSGNIAGPSENENRSSLSNPFPNPTNNLTRIDYQLPARINQGELIFYDITGAEVKRFKVTNVFSFIYVSANDLPSGTYYYTLQTSAGFSEGKKMVVIR